MVYTSSSTEQTEKIAEELAKATPVPCTFCLSGELGAGKTAFARGLARGYGCKGRVTSPTFTLLNIYEGSVPVYHFDLYRLHDEDELFDIGFEPSTPEAVTVVEWFEPFHRLFRGSPCLFVTIEGSGDDPRRIVIERSFSNEHTGH